MPLLGYIPGDAIHGMYVCALRFDGYRYQQEYLPDADDRGLANLTDPIRESLLFPRDLNSNLAAFFWTQRRLKEDDMLRDSRDHVLFDLLFLHLYQVEIPTRFINKDFIRDWEEYTQEQVDIMAAMIRDSFTSAPRIVPKVY